MSEKISSSYFSTIQRQLQNSGVSVKYINRTIDELSDHLQDIRDENKGQPVTFQQAVDRLGEPRIIVQQLASRTELRSWIYRYPRLARIYLPIAWVLLLPVAPIFAGVANPSFTLRWSAALLFSALVTATLLRIMELSIAII